jgi:hypothetical protein
MYKAIDCLGFAGGFTMGMAQAGFELIAKREHRGGFGVANCEANRHLLPGPWKAQASPADQWEVMPDASVVFGNPPCSRPGSPVCRQNISVVRILQLTPVCGILQSTLRV